MASEPKTIAVEPGSELDRLLGEAAGRSLRLVRGGVHYPVAREGEDIWAGYDPELARASTLAAAGSWKDIDAEDEDIWAGHDPQATRDGTHRAAGIWSDLDPEELKADVYRGRDEGTRPPDRP